LKNTKNFSKVSLAELLNALKAQEKKRLMREETTFEGVSAVKQQNVGSTSINATEKNDYTHF